MTIFSSLFEMDKAQRTRAHVEKLAKILDRHPACKRSPAINKMDFLANTGGLFYDQGGRHRFGTGHRQIHYPAARRRYRPGLYGWKRNHRVIILAGDRAPTRPSLR
jgi:hypothetical protein